MTAASALAALLLAASGPASLEKVGFDEAVRLALAKNPSAVVAAEEVRRAEGILGEARSGSMPFLGVTGTLIWLDHDRTAGSNTIATSSQANATMIVGGQVVVDKGAVTAARPGRAVRAAVAAR